MIDEKKLRPHQVAPAKWLETVLQLNPSAVDFSDTGVGKTYVAAAVANSLRLPTCVVCPKIAITSWHRAAAHFNDKFSVINYESIRTGRTPFGKWSNQDQVEQARTEYFVCQCCQQQVDVEKETPCYAHHLGIHCIEKRVRQIFYGAFSFSPGIQLLVFDEAHRCGGLDSLNAEMLIAARRQGIRTLALTATAASTPLQMRALGYALDLHGDKFPALKNGKWQKTFHAWAHAHGCRRIPPLPGLRWAVGAATQNEIMSGLRSQIIPARGVRVTTDSIPGFPEREITAELYDIEHPESIDRLYSEMADALRILETKKSNDICPSHPLTIQLRARQRIELLKIPIAVELAEDYMAKGYSIAIFINFRQTLDELRQRLKCDCFIDGSAEGTANRQQNIDRFQANNSRLILVNNEAGGICVSLQDLSGNHPRGGLVMPPQSAVTFRQLVGRLHRDGGKSKCFYRVMFAAGTIEDQVHRSLRAKLNNLDALNDSDFQPDNLRLTKF